MRGRIRSYGREKVTSLQCMGAVGLGWGRWQALVLQRVRVRKMHSAPACTENTEDHSSKCCVGIYF